MIYYTNRDIQWNIILIIYLKNIIYDMYNLLKREIYINKI